ncbi:MAG: DUF4058 family protein [Planctomycetes bacterium]|nr:DUF4058 family protein [Planctomycetota bacterium]
MDPYLECSRCLSFHNQLVCDYARQLSPTLLPNYYAETTERLIYADFDDLTIASEPAPHFSVGIHGTQTGRLICAIELLSAMSKQGRPHREYLRQRERILRSTAHLLEIDLVRKGKRLPMVEELPRADYYVFLSRAERRPRTEVWPIRLRDPLPTVPVPLLPGDEDVELDLQAAFTNVYDLLGYRFSTNYSGPPAVPLDEADREWAEERLRAAGLRA